MNASVCPYGPNCSTCLAAYHNHTFYHPTTQQQLLHDPGNIYAAHYYAHPMMPANSLFTAIPITSTNIHAMHDQRNIYSDNYEYHSHGVASHAPAPTHQTNNAFPPAQPQPVTYPVVPPTAPTQQTNIAIPTSQAQPVNYPVVPPTAYAHQTNNTISTGQSQSVTYAAVPPTALAQQTYSTPSNLNLDQSQYDPLAFAPSQYGYMALGQQNLPVQPNVTSVVQNSMPTNQSSLTHYHSDLQHDLSDFESQAAYYNSPQNMQYGPLGSSPPDPYLDQHSASSSDCGWHIVGEASPRSSFESYAEMQAEYGFAVLPPAVNNPSMTLHHRSDSNSTYDDVAMSPDSDDDFENIAFPMESPTFAHAELAPMEEELSPQPSHSSNSQSEPTSPEQTRSVPSISPPAASPRSRPKRNSQSKMSKSLVKKPIVNLKVETDAVEKRGKRKGPLRAEQRKQAGLIRKKGACLRCKFLKKTCDTGDICNGCKPSHARLWIVPCCRRDFKEFDYFMADWNADHKRHPSLATPAGLVRDVHNSHVTTLYVSHGYGLMFSVDAREVIFSDNKFSLVDWSEGTYPAGRNNFNVATENLCVLTVDANLLNEYVERHIGPKFPDFVRKHFQGTKFLTEMLLTAYNFYRKTGSRIVKNALKLLVAYNLTMQVAFVEPRTRDNSKHGRVDNPQSNYHNRVVAPMLVSQAIKDAMAVMWRDLQKDVLAELGSMFHKVYTGDKQKNWPTIFIVATLLLAVWEEIQFDAHYREPDEEKVEKFCNDMEKEPVKVIVTLFQTISQKVPAFSEWDTNAHHYVLESNEAACDAMSEIRDTVNKHEDYLRERAQGCAFDSNDFDSLSNKFLSQLVIHP